MNLRDGTARKVREVLGALAEGRVEPWMVAHAREVLPAFARAEAPEKPELPSLRHETARRVSEESRAAAERKAIRQAVAERAGGRCEACGRPVGETLHWDHFWGRAREESIESTWMLCPVCDTSKTENRPSRLSWLSLFLSHVQIHRYREQEAKVRRTMALEQAQHPTTERASG